jgi:hypothetical protein
MTPYWLKGFWKEIEPLGLLLLMRLGNFEARVDFTAKRSVTFERVRKEHHSAFY